MAEPKPAPHSTTDVDVESTSTHGQGDARPRPVDDTRPKEIGGTDGPEPTRYGDWEHNGRCTDF